MRRYALRDEQWERIEGLLPGREGPVAVTAKDNRLFVEAVLYPYRAGIPGRDWPERLGPWKAVPTPLSPWAVSGVWAQVFRHLAGEADTEYAIIDSTIVRAPQHRAGAQKRGRRPGDRTQPRRVEHQDPRHRRGPGLPDRLLVDARPSRRPG